MKTKRIILAVLTSGGYGREVVEGIQDYAHSQAPHWEFYFEGACNHPSVQTYLRLAVTDWHAHGIIGQLMHGDLPALVHKHRLPAVNVSSSIPTTIPSVVPHAGMIGTMAARYFLDRGLRNLAFIGRNSCMYATQQQATFQAEGIAAGVSCHLLPEYSRQPTTWVEEFKRIVTWLRKLPRPLGIFACDDRRGRDVLQACHTLGVRVPYDIAVLGSDNDETSCLLSAPPLSSVILQGQNIGFQAAELLDRLMSGKARPKHPILVEPAGIVTRRSTDIVASDDPNTTAALRFIHDQAHRPITVHDVLAAAPQSRRAMERRFRQSLGRTPKEEIRRVHLERAKFLLSQTDHKIQNLATEAGYSRYSLFVKEFHAHTGMTPSSFRAQLRISSPLKAQK